MRIKGKEEFLKQIAALPEAIRAEVSKSLETSADETTDVMRRFCRSHVVRASIGWSFGDAPKGATFKTNGQAARAAKLETRLAVTMYAGGGDAWIARIEEFGTAPHVIKARRAKVMARNGKIYGKRVQHPGATAQPFFYPGYRLGKKRAKSRLSRAIRNGARKAFG